MWTLQNSTRTNSKSFSWKERTSCSSTAGNSSVIKDLELQVDSNLNLSQQSALAAKKPNSIWGCINRNTASTLKEQIIHPLLNSC